MKAPWIFIFVMLLCALFPITASADEFQEFQRAREAYRQQKYGSAAELFEALIEGPSPLENQALRLEARKYLGASYLFTKRRPKAARQFRLLVSEDPEYQLDPLAFPSEVLKLFERVREQELARRAKEIAAKADEEQRQQQQAATQQLQQGQYLQGLIDLAETERVQEQRSRWIALLPFGIGQFHNGHDDLGLTLAIIEGALAAVSLTSRLVYETIDIPVKTVGEPSSATRQDAENAESIWYATNLISTGLLVVVAIAGIIDAQVRFRPTAERTRHRPLPKELREGLRLQASVDGTHVLFKF